MHRIILLIALCILSLQTHAQTRFKIANWNAVKIAGDENSSKSFYYLSFGVLADKRFKLNHEIRLGLLYKSMEYSFGKEDYNFKTFLQQQNPLYTASLFKNITEAKVAFGYLSIPMGYNYYFGPRVYLSYNLNMNITLGNANYSTTDSTENTVLDGKLGKGLVRGMFFDHELTFNFIILRRFEVFLGSSWNVNSSLLKRITNLSFIQDFGKSSSKYAMMKLGTNIYIFQIKRKRL